MSVVYKPLREMDIDELLNVMSSAGNVLVGRAREQYQDSAIEAFNWYAAENNADELDRIIEETQDASHERVDDSYWVIYYAPAGVVAQYGDRVHDDLSDRVAEMGWENPDSTHVAYVFGRMTFEGAVEQMRQAAEEALSGAMDDPEFDAEDWIFVADAGESQYDDISVRLERKP